MPTTLKSKSIDELLAEADELVQKYNSEFLEDLKEEHLLQFEKHAQKDCRNSNRKFRPRPRKKEQ